jgi:tripeptide aminopeptidase
MENQIRSEIMSNVVERFLGYVKFDTKSDEESETVPTTFGQKVFGGELVSELKRMGVRDIEIDDTGYVYGTLPGNIDKKVKTIGFIAHMDTSPDMSGKRVNPRIVVNYDGGDIILNKEEDIVLSPVEFTELPMYKGKDLIVTDGLTLLGADDKAGVAEIITALEYLINHPEIKHGDIKIGFTPDEEVGKGADYFNVEKFGADLAYTVDGGRLGELEYESFNAASGKVAIKGRNVHPGSAKGKMINALLIANEFINSLPAEEVPEKTEKYQGFYHLMSIKGEVEEAKLSYIIRDFSTEGFEKRKEIFKNAADKLNEKYGNHVTAVVKDQYYNMKEKIEKDIYIVDNAFKAMKEAGITPNIIPIRGGTDGSRLSFMGLPTPNIFAGGENFHGKFEYIPTFAMEKAVETILKIIEIYAEN